MNASVEMPKMTFRQKYIGDKKFYKNVLKITVPIMIQNGITNFVSMLDNIMVGQIGTEQMSGVSIANQLMFVYMLCVFGGIGGIGIFTAQYYGSNDAEGMRSSVRFKLHMAFIITAIAAVVMLVFGDPLMSLFLNDEENASGIEATLNYGRVYLRTVLFSLPAFMLLQVYAFSQRECGETATPMKAGIATVMSRYVEAAIVIIWSHRHKRRMPWADGLYRTLKVPFKNVLRFLSKGAPLLFNEALWSIGMSTLTQCYSMRGLNVIVAFNISNTVANLTNIVYMAMGNSVAIIVGQLLGAGKLKEAKDSDTKIMFFSVIAGFVTTLLMLIAAKWFPMVYNTNDVAKHMASQAIIVFGLVSPVFAFTHCSYFTLRSGGRTGITFIFDTGFTWVISVPTALLLSRLTSLSAITMYATICSMELIKAVIGYVMVKKNIWIRNIVS